MADTEINVTGEMDVPASGQKQSFLQFAQKVEFSAPAAKEWLGATRENVRPWTTFLNTSNFKTPPSLPRLSKRIMRNIEYFQSNYLFIFVGLFIYCLLTSPLLLIVVAVCVGFGYHLSKRYGEKKLTLLGKEVSLAQQYGAVAICSIPLFIWAGAGAAVFWVLGASVVIMRSKATELYKSYIRSAGIVIVLFIIVFLSFVGDFLFFFCLYYVGASCFFITLHAAFFNIEAVVQSDDPLALLEEV